MEVFQENFETDNIINKTQYHIKTKYRFETNNIKEKIFKEKFLKQVISFRNVKFKKNF